MIGKLTYEQIDELVQRLSTSTQTLKSILSQCSGSDAVAIRATKLLKFCNEVEQYIAKLNESVNLNKDVDNVVNRLVSNNN